jgi:UDP-N-acetylglucosamine acyltransferase
MIHETAVISSDAVIADGVEIGAFAVVGPKVTIGAGTVIGPHVVIKGPAVIGQNNRVFQFASLGDDPQDKKYSGEETSLVIGDNNTIRECVTINRGTVQDKGVTRIGDRNWLMAYVHIAHDCDVGNDVTMANNSGLAGHVRVDDFATFGGFSGAHQFCRIGAYSFLGIYSGVTKDVPPFVTVTGQPAVARKINTEGLRRRGYSPEQIRHVKEAFKLLYRSGLRVAEAFDRIGEIAQAEGELEPLLDFLKEPGRGIVR